jgi:hypothetical protein
VKLYQWLVMHGFQVLCMLCSQSKNDRAACSVDHARQREKARYLFDVMPDGQQQRFLEWLEMKQVAEPA